MDTKKTEQKKPLQDEGALKSASTYSPTLKRAVPSAQAGLTSLFGMGRGGPCCYKHPKSLIPRFYKKIVVSQNFSDISDDQSSIQY